MRKRTPKFTGWEGTARDYLEFRRRLGFSLHSAGEEVLLFGRFLDSINHDGPLTADVAVRWAKLPTHSQPAYWAWRLGAVRMFAMHLAAADPRHEVPARDAAGRAYGRGNPHIYSPQEVQDLLDAARRVKPITDLPPQTYRTFFGLLASTGLRCGEALSLQRADVNLDQGMLLIAKGKPGRTRVVPMHSTTTEALVEYACRRDTRFSDGGKSTAFFLSRRGTALSYQRVNKTFRELRHVLAWKTEPPPRLHDLRHTFAVRNLLRWSEAGDDVDAKITFLSAYLGHVNVTHTYWYFSAVPELMAVAGQRFETFAQEGVNHD